MSNTTSEIPRFERQLPLPEGVVENYKYAYTEHYSYYLFGIFHMFIVKFYVCIQLHFISS